MKKRIDDRSAMAKAMSKVSDITAICLLMIVPGLIGYFIDQQVGTGFVFMLIGMAFGMTGAVYQLIRLVSAIQNSTPDSRLDDDESDRT